MHWEFGPYGELGEASSPALPFPALGLSHLGLEASGASVVYPIWNPAIPMSPLTLAHTVPFCVVVSLSVCGHRALGPAPRIR